MPCASATLRKADRYTTGSGSSATAVRQSIGTAQVTLVDIDSRLALIERGAVWPPPTIALA